MRKSSVIAAGLLLALQTCMAADVMSLTASSPEVREVFERALKADANKLLQWSRKPEKSGADLRKFCPEYEQKYLKALLNALAEYKTHMIAARAALSGAGRRRPSPAPSLDEADEDYRQMAEARGGGAGISAAPGFGDYVAAMRAKAEAIHNLYLLISFRPVSKDTLRALLGYAKAAAEAAEPDPGAKEIIDAVDKHLAAIDAPAPQRVRVSQPVAYCYELSTVKPLYPASQRYAGIEGKAVLLVVIGRSGHVEQVTPISGDGEFTAAATESVRQWTYRPYYLGGEPVEFETQAIINFQLSYRP